MEWRFWRKESWEASPTKAMIAVGLVLSIVLYGAMFLASLGVASLAVTTDTEERLVEQVLATADDNEDVAELVLASNIPSACFPETDNEQLLRMRAEFLWLSKNRCELELDANNEPLPCKQVLDYLASAKTDRDTLAKGIEAIAKDETLPEPIRDSASRPSAIEPKGKLFEPRGPDSSTCVTKLNEASPYPSISSTMMSDLLGMELKLSEWIGDAQKEPKPDVKEDEKGMAALQPEESAAAFITSYGGGRPSLEGLRGLSQPKAEDDQLSLEVLWAEASRALKRDRAQSHAEDDIGEEVRQTGYEEFTTVLKEGATHLLFFALILILWGAFTGLAGWRRWCAGFVLVAVVVGFLAPDALTSLGVEKAKDVGGDTESFNSLVGAPFALLAMLLDFFQNVVASVGKVETQQAILYAALFAAIFLAQSQLALVGAAYGMLVVPTWIDTGVFSVLPWNLDMLDVAIMLPLVLWFVQIVSVILAAMVARGVWAKWGVAIVQRGKELMQQEVALAPAGSGEGVEKLKEE
jgi:hypothetical protein